MEDLDADYLANKRSIFGDIKSEDTKSRGASYYEDSAGSQDGEDVSMKKQVSGRVYDRTPSNGATRSSIYCQEEAKGSL